MEKPTDENGQLQNLAKDKKLMDQLKESIASGKNKLANELGVVPDDVDQHQRNLGSLAPAAIPTDSDNTQVGRTEAIILEFSRPTLLIQDNQFETPLNSDWALILDSGRSRIESTFPSVGRVELMHHDQLSWAGTGWLIAPDVVITNRHVAANFATTASADNFAFKRNFRGKTIGAQIDFFEEHKRDSVAEVRVEKILYIAPRGDDHADIALLKIVRDNRTPAPLSLADRLPKRGDPVGIIGYPARDSRRNNSEWMQRYFQNIYNVKRFAPGLVIDTPAGEHYFRTDYTSLGGNSGSAVIDLDNGSVIGLHYKGLRESANYAVGMKAIKEALSTGAISVPAFSANNAGNPTESAAEETPEANKTHKPEHYVGREGYLADFLGGAEHSVPLPKLGFWEDDEAPVEDSPAGQPGVARYEHFSVILSRSRKLAALTAVNIDGGQLRRIPRHNRWYLDGRIHESFQTGNELYRNNDLDRGHLVRRLDPVWGDEESATKANDDSFHYSNSAPQHARFNRRTWLELESLILDHADAKDQKLSVFTGPVFDNMDPIYRDVQIPQAFWKVVVMVNRENQQLAALGFLFCQGELLSSLQESVLQPGTLNVFQVPLAEIESQSGLQFGSLKEADVLQAGNQESAAAVTVIRGVESITMPTL